MRKKYVVSHRNHEGQGWAYFKTFRTLYFAKRYISKRIININYINQWRILNTDIPSSEDRGILEICRSHIKEKTIFNNKNGKYV